MECSGIDALGQQLCQRPQSSGAGRDARNFNYLSGKCVNFDREFLSIARGYEMVNFPLACSGLNIRKRISADYRSGLLTSLRLFIGAEDFGNKLIPTFSKGQFACGGLVLSQFGVGLVSISQFTIAGYAVAQIAIAYSLIAQFGLYLSHGRGQLVKSVGELVRLFWSPA